MATRRISLAPEAYEKLCRARLEPEESFSEVILRARCPESEETATGAELLAHWQAHGPFLTEEELERIELADEH